jgi:two-component system, OmpR family, sensor histidine kinase VicK
MLESSLAAALHFTLEFAGFVVATGAAVLVASRSELLPGRALGRFTAAGGFLVLALVSVLHGASFIRADADTALIALRAVGWVVIGLAIAGAQPVAASSAVIASGKPILFAPAGASLFAGLAAAARARSHHALNRMAVAAAITAAAEALIAITRSTVVEDASGSRLLYAAHGLRFLGYLTLCAWLWTVVQRSVKSRFIAAIAALLVVVVLALSTTLTAVISNNIEAEGLARVRTQLTAALRDIEDQEEDLGAFLADLNTSADFDQAVNSGALEQTAVELAGSETLDLDFFGFVSDRATVLAGDGPATSASRVGPLGPTQRAALLESSVVAQARDAGRAFVGVGALRNQSAAVLAAVPVGSGRRETVVLAGRYLDGSTIEEVSARVDPARASLFIDGRPVVSALDTVPPLPAFVRDQPPSTIVTRQQQLHADELFSAFARLESRDGDVIFALSAPSEVVSDTRQDLTRAMFLAALAVGGIALILAWLSGRRITRPIRKLTVTADAVASGDLSARAPVSGEDELGLLGTTFNDMTSSLVRKTEEEQALRNRIETIIQSMADGLVAVDNRGRILAFNIEAELLSGVRAEDALGSSVGDVLDVRDARGEAMTLPIHSLTEGAVGGVYMARRLGPPVPVAITTAVLHDEDGAVAGGVAVIRDMSREHELEKLKGEFLSNISHELRTPLTPIKGYAEILSRSGVPEQRMVHFARGILDATQKLERIVALLVDYASIEAGKLAPRASSVDVGSIVESLAAEWGKRAPRHEFQTSISPHLPLASGDERLLKRTLEEVVDNAVKFSPGGGKVRLEARSATNGMDGGARVEVSVSDNGIGIAPEDLPTIFSDFHQLDSSETRTYGGLGLGLAFVQRIVQAHQGEVTVDSTPNAGTRLTIVIPAAGDGRVGV